MGELLCLPVLHETPLMGDLLRPKIVFKDIALGDLPVEALEPYGIRALHPDASVQELTAESYKGVLCAVRKRRRTQRRPPISPEEYTEVLRSARLDEAARFATRHRGAL